MFLPKEQYLQIHQSMPICCVDVVVFINDKVLLIKRADHPSIGEWWMVGGRVMRNETLQQAAIRIIKKECNLDVLDTSVIGVDETIFTTDPFGHGKGTHTVNVIMMASCTGTVQLDNTSSTYFILPPNEVYKLASSQYVVKHTASAMLKRMSGTACGTATK